MVPSGYHLVAGGSALGVAPYVPAYRGARSRGSMDLPPAARRPACTWTHLVDRSVVARACVYIVR